jgi:hypothetical protein
VIKDNHFGARRGAATKSASSSWVHYYDTSYFEGTADDLNGVANLVVDYGIFVRCTFDNVVMYYDGGAYYFDSSNIFTHQSRFVFGPHVSQQTQNYLRHLSGELSCHMRAPYWTFFASLIFALTPAYTAAQGSQVRSYQRAVRQRP